jgi:hypothetical protein
MDATPTALNNDRGAASRNRAVVRIGVLALVVALASLLWLVGSSASERVETKETEDWLESTTLESFVLDDASVEEAIKVINGEIERAHRPWSNVRVHLATPEETAKCFKPQLKPLVAPPVIPGLPSESPLVSGASRSPPSPLEQKLALRLKNLPLREAIMYVAGLSDMEWDVRERSILLHRVPSRDGTVKPIVTKSLRFRWLPPQFDEKSGIDPRQYLEASGILFYEGCSVKVDARTRTLRMTSTEDAFDLLGLVWDSEPTVFQKIQWWIGSWMPRRIGAAPAPSPRGEIVIPGRREAIPGLEPLPGI